MKTFDVTYSDIEKHLGQADLSTKVQDILDWAKEHAATLDTSLKQQGSDTDSAYAQGDEAPYFLMCKRYIVLAVAVDVIRGITRANPEQAQAANKEAFAQLLKIEDSIESLVEDFDKFKHRATPRGNQTTRPPGVRRPRFWRRGRGI